MSDKGKKNATQGGMEFNMYTMITETMVTESVDTQVPLYNTYLRKNADQIYFWPLHCRLRHIPTFLSDEEANGRWLTQPQYVAKVL